jgi:hypothetical protein
MVLRIRVLTLLFAVAVVAAGSFAVPVATLAQEDAVALGETGSIGGLEITVLEWIPDATGMIDEDMVPPGQLAEDETHVLARLLVGNTGDNPDMAMGMGLPAFGVAGESRVGYLTDSCGSLYQSPLMITEIIPGSEGEIEICWRVPTADVGSLSMFVREYDPSMGNAFLTEEEESDEPVGMTWFLLGNGTVPAYDGGQVLDGEVVDDGSLEDPIPVGSVGRIGSYEVAIASVNHDATDEVLALNEWNEPPGPGEQYILVDIAVGYAGDGLGSVDDLMFDPMLDYSTFFDTYSCDTGTMGGMYMSPLLFPGAETTVTVCALVETGSVGSIVLMATTMEDLDAMPPFFSLQP